MSNHESVNSEADESDFTYPDDPFDPNELVTNDAVAGEPVDPTGHYAGPAGSEPLEASPEYDEHEPNVDDGPTDLAE
jgi:hypothetical protein